MKFDLFFPEWVPEKSLPGGWPPHRGIPKTSQIAYGIAAGGEWGGVGASSKRNDSRSFLYIFRYTYRYGSSHCTLNKGLRSFRRGFNAQRSEPKSAPYIGRLCRRPPSTVCVDCAQVGLRNIRKGAESNAAAPRGGGGEIEDGQILMVQVLLFLLLARNEQY